jgi:hypothetical protein
MIATGLISFDCFSDSPGLAAMCEAGLRQFPAV